jgi:hypothetical protein
MNGGPTPYRPAPACAKTGRFPRLVRQSGRWGDVPDPGRARLVHRPAERIGDGGRASRPGGGGEEPLTEDEQRQQIESTQPDAVLGLDQTELPRVETGAVETMGVEQIDVVEDLAAAGEPDSRATVGSVSSDPLASAAHDPDELHGFKGTAAVREMVGSRVPVSTRILSQRPASRPACACRCFLMWCRHGVRTPRQTRSRSRRGGLRRARICFLGPIWDHTSCTPADIGYVGRADER